ncbi:MULTISPECIES: hypothetical protein [Clostridium]|jgi:hypothetical protein|uniref:Uncharacterized protein n=1 Tax=Clostridium disporicum TaxID=84024 RepID=A0A174EDC4_9CLOT|nr:MULTISPECIES: hypothetical protein [Clostridium]MBX9183328.1 hypothetical protein [Clostridium sp. K04]MDU3520720.1 hypothetical protein [Clostridium saudiense]MDU7453221.1 hypothetical protein [Clostridium saudiense]MEE0728762.1 hypothetical protein [Clostridium saudiense]CUN83792.1 Uncharacterised protein [Clostridium disporicum]
MAKYINNEFSSSDWLRYFSNKSNHWILKYWRNNKDIFFNRFMIIGDKRLLIIGDKERGNTYEFLKPQGESFIQLDMEI